MDQLHPGCRANLVCDGTPSISVRLSTLCRHPHSYQESAQTKSASIDTGSTHCLTDFYHSHCATHSKTGKNRHRLQTLPHGFLSSTPAATSTSRISIIHTGCNLYLTDFYHPHRLQPLPHGFLSSTPAATLTSWTSIIHTGGNPYLMDFYHPHSTTKPAEQVFHCTPRVRTTPRTEVKETTLRVRTPATQWARTNAENMCNHNTTKVC